MSDDIKQLLEEGVAASKSGDKERATELLTQVLSQDPDNVQALYYLASVQSDPLKSKEYLEKAAAIAPDNESVQKALKKVTARIQGKSSVEERAQEAREKAKEFAGKEFQSDLLDAIPDAPKSVSIAGLFAAGVGVFRQSLTAFLTRGGNMENAVKHASWWRFWVAAVTGSLASAVIFFIADLIGPQFTVARLIAGLVGIVLSVIIGAVAVYVGSCFTRSWLGGHSSELVDYAYALAVPWVFGTIANALVFFVVDLVGTSNILGLVGLIASGVIAWMVMSAQIKGLKAIGGGSRLWLNSIAMLTTTTIFYMLVMGIYSSIILSPIRLALG